MSSYRVVFEIALLIPMMGLLAEVVFARSRAVRILLSGLWLLLTAYLAVAYTQPIEIYVGNWSAPFGISLIADRLSTMMLAIFTFVATVIFVYSQNDSQAQKGFYSGYWLLLLGSAGLLFTADLFNIYVWTEIILVSAIILLSSSSYPKRTQVMHYAVVNIFGTLLMLIAIAMIYSATGHLNIYAIGTAIGSNSSLYAPMLLLLFAFGMKAAFFPLYFWLPSAYPKTSLSALMLLSSIVTKLMVVILLRLFWLWTPLSDPTIKKLLLACACATMFFGVMGAANQSRLRQILSFHIVSQLGYLILALSLPTPINHMALLYFLIHNVVIKTNLFMVTGMIEQGYGNDNLQRLGAINKDSLILSALFLLSALSLVGIPPFSGFWGKFLILKTTVEEGYFITALIAIMVSLFTLYSMFKIWRYAFCETAKRPMTFNGQAIHMSHILCSIVLLVSSLMIALSPDWFLQLLQSVH